MLLEKAVDVLRVVQVKALADENESCQEASQKNQEDIHRAALYKRAANKARESQLRVDMQLE